MSKPKSAGSRNEQRSAARLAAVQALYQMDVGNATLEAVIAEFVTHRMGDETLAEGTPADADEIYFAEIMRGVVRRQRDIDPLIDQQLAEGWRLVRVDSILRATLRAATFELFERSEVPARVVINEYIEVARAFFEGDEPRVVNGVLDKIARKLRAGELERKSAGG
jgi:N utilization substance protein B